MSFVLDLICLLMCSIIFLKCIKDIFNVKYSIFHFCCILFYLMQVLPILISFFGDLSGIKKYYPYMYISMIDSKVSIIYDIFCIVTMLFLFLNSKKYCGRYRLKIQVSKYINEDNASIISLICFLGVLLALVFGVAFSPKPTIYAKFSYFYTHSFLSNSSEYLYHINILNKLVRLSFILTIIYYYLNCFKKGTNTMVLLSTFFITWINGKRTLLLFLLFSFIIIDFIKIDRNDKKAMKKIVNKAFFFLLMFLCYYLLYNYVTKKSSFADNYLLYSTYFSRMSNVKTSIYSLLYDNNMLNYRGETLLFDIFFYVPRRIWNAKPLPFFTQFTSYVYYGKPNIVVSSMRFQVNMWSEFISNLGIFGYLLALMFVKFVIVKSEKANNKIVYFSGMLFILLYFVYGFEKIEQILFVFWIFGLIRNKLKGSYK